MNVRSRPLRAFRFVPMFAICALAALGASGARSAVCAPLSGPFSDDAAVAKAGVERITRSELQQQMLTYYGHTALEELTNRSVVRQETTRLKVTVSEADLDTRVAELKKVNDGAIAEAIRKGDIVESALREQAKYGLLAEKLLDTKWPVKPDDLIRYSAQFARTQSQQEARSVIRDAKRGVDFGNLASQGNQGEDPQVQPDPFMRIDNPAFYKAVSEANLRPGQVSAQPYVAGNYLLVLKLNKVFGPETLTATQKKDATARIRAARFRALIPASRKRYRIAAVTPMDELLQNPKMSGDTVLTRVGMDPITRKDLIVYLLEAYGKSALEQLIERKIVHQEALQSGVDVSAAEITERMAAAQKDAKAFQAALDSEGITEDAVRDRVRYSMLAEKIVEARAPLPLSELERLAVRYARVSTAQEADQLIQAAAAGADFEQLVKQRSLDRDGDGFIQPKPFLKVENPKVFEAVAKLGQGDVLDKPLPLANAYLVLKLEARFGPETMTGRERDDAVRRIDAVRMTRLLDEYRKQFTIEYLVPVSALVTDAKA